ncbi:D-TA family PLP-dependent enzyme [Aggregicoccus sp. 17bor-14]|uniref:D-TA family PLP-dependent enzyme n=1 Tax=Myxococcaceae TaxID=31 RepID=UPI00129C447D|nr:MULTISPECIES: D-TA family PLP-dependent enzyme [Myxococcaceae]MBF5040831.1 D-TA family PLP-dependent enzyme [Simulacricoccus sp. 17bor-14]MRI86620.1 D-TA family PLP-dependent enzyme [Aggregicoccus sp. 17bor-14]
MTEVQHIDALTTPAALVDLAQVEANLRRGDAYARSHGLRWRPHIKTHKTRELAALQLQAGATGVTVATQRELELMASVTDDLFLAYPPVGAQRLARLMALPAQVRLRVAVDSLEVLTPLADAARAAGRSVGVMVELDLGMHRVGVQQPEEAVALAREASRTEGLRYEGICFYPGHVRVPLAEQDGALAALTHALGRHRAALEAAGLAPPEVSGGSTPTLWRSHEIPGLTEIRPGIHLFYDRASALLGSCAWEEISYSVLATVVSTAVPGQAVVDAGSKALAKEEPPRGVGYAALRDHPEVLLRSLSEEHGLLDLSGSSWRPRVGERVRLVPNHVCVSVNLHEQLWGVRGDEVVHKWGVAARGW